MSNAPDYRVFGFQHDGQFRANLYNGPGHPEAGVMYSWLVCTTLSELAYKLAEQWEEQLAEDEWTVLEELEQRPVSPFTAELEIDCEECGGSSVDPGGLNAYEPEDCRACHGTGRETTVAPVAARRPQGRRVVAPSARKEVA